LIFRIQTIGADGLTQVNSSNIHTRQLTAPALPAKNALFHKESALVADVD
jgi:hypothetical protein